MSTVVPLAQYCERSAAGFWAEPVNAWTNVVFLLAAWLVGRRLRRQRGGFARWWDLWLLVALSVAVGVGSFLWHTLRSGWTQWADIVPILLFINVFLASFLVRVAGLGVAGAGAGLVVFNVVNVGVQMALPPALLNGSVFYLPTWLTLAGVCVYTWVRDASSGRLLLAALLLFTLSLTLRTLDQAWCALTGGLGTHFGWHLFNGALLYAASMALLIHTPARRFRQPQGI